MVAFFTVIHVLLCVFMIFVILLQPGKDAGMGAALGGGAATSAFGGRGAVTFLSKLTAVCAGLFFLTSLGLSFVGVRSSVTSSLLAKPAPVAAPAPAAPGSTPPAAPAAGSTAPPAAPGSTPPAAPAAGSTAPAAGSTAPAPKARDAEPAPAATPAPAPAAPAQK